MDGYALILTVDDEIKVVEYQGFSKIKEQTDMDLAQLFQTDTMKGFSKDTFSYFTYCAYCDEEGLCHDTKGNNKVNVYATILYKNPNPYMMIMPRPIYGDCFILKLNKTRDDNIGLTKEEAEGFKDILENIVEKSGKAIFGNKEELFRMYHDEFDNKKPEPEMKVIFFDDRDDR